MGITVAFRGTLAEATKRQAALEHAVRFATDMQWHVENVEISPEGLVRLGERPPTAGKLSGLSLLPHFACERIPLVFLDPGGALVDIAVQQRADGEIRLSAEPIVKTQFAGFPVHQEVCTFLGDLAEHFISDLRVEDESGYFDSGDEGQARRAFDEAWIALGSWVKEQGFAPGDEYEIGGEAFRCEDPGVDRPEESDALLPPELRHHFADLHRYLATRYGGFGLDLDGSESSLENLDLLMTESDDEGWGRDIEDPDTEVFAHALGVYFGTWVARHLGGRWELAGEAGPRLFDVAGTGLVIDPFQIAAERLTRGPAWSFAYHVELYHTMRRYLP